MNIEHIVILTYILIIFLIAFLSRPKNQSSEEIFLAGKSLSIPESIFSIIATEVSALTFIGIPAFSFGLDFRFIYVYVGAIFGRYIIARYLIPKYYGEGLTVYSIAFKNKSAQKKLATSIYLISKTLSIGVRLYSGSILISAYFNLHIITAIVLLSFLTYLYTQIGGLKTVVRTDILQTLIFIGGGISAHILIPDIANQKWMDMILVGLKDNKIITFDISYLPIILTGIFGGALFDIASHGVDQDFAQRLLANKSKKGAQVSILFSSFFSIAIGLLFLSIGTLLYSYHQEVEFIGKTDFVFSNFIINNFPPLLKGFMLAGVLAATMSTLDSTINAVNSCLHSDFSIKISKKVSGFFSMIGLLIVAIFATQSSGLLTVGLKVASWSSGFLLAIIYLALFKEKFFNPRLMAIAYFINLISIYGVSEIFGLTWHWFTYVGSAITFVLALIFERLKKSKSNLTFS
jgi:solute:Na+ symporter, SSS family